MYQHNLIDAFTSELYVDAFQEKNLELFMVLKDILIMV